jgi:alpha-glucosidase (family GH31 glycosyl hydrolase)
MKKALLLFIPLILAFPVKAQNHIDPKVFWHENFKTDKLPDGWKNVDNSKQNLEWIVTDQPYPGSYQYQQQAPPIASKSRGYYLQFQPGYMVDEDQESWFKKKQYPDTWVQTPEIDCSNKASVILKFQQTFRYNANESRSDASITVGVSTDGQKWTDYDVTNHVAPATDMFDPINEELNISKVAANQPKVYIRFYWKGYYSWYWMIDDVELSEAYPTDISLTRVTSNTEKNNVFGKQDNLSVMLKNNGSKPVDQNIVVTCLLDSKTSLTAIVPSGTKPLQPGDEYNVVFPATDLSQKSSHTVKFTVNYPGDELAENNTLSLKMTAKSASIGNLTSFKQVKNEADISSKQNKFKVIFYSNNIFRIWMAPDGEFTNPAGNDIVESYATNSPTVTSTDKGAYYQIKSKSCVLRVYKKPLKFAMYDETDTKMIWTETKPLTYGDKTIQSLTRQPNEYFYGGGMQNGYFSHRGTTLLIEKGNGWDNGGRPNPAPFYMSTAGYGAFRNTFDVGKYAFDDTLKLSHNENRFDCFYFYGPSLKRILDGYTRTTGRPFFMPRWALSMGDANCYNRGVKGYDTKNYTGSGKTGTTPDVISVVADQYVAHDMPRGWILPNDGYGCGYTKLDSTIMELHKRGFYTGLWTENGIDKIAKEVGVYGSRVCKLDVAWVGPGYKFALDACKSAYNGIENNSDSRGFVWSVMGWAGTQKYSTVWTGDQSGNWEYIRFHIPTVIGAGLSAQNAATGDVDGIFGGSDSTYVRDLQWKCFTPVFMAMSGWAKKDRQPYINGEPYTSINRKYLDLKMRLTPYMYTYCHQASITGVPTTRAMVLEYPNDPVTWGKATQYQFMNGQWLLIAPVYKSEAKRDSIYLPKGTWYDYWSGKAIAGSTWLNNYPAPLDKLPIFVKAGAIIPMYPQMNYDGEKKTDSLTLDIYPSGHSSFDLYEDDGKTRAYKTGAYATTLIAVAKEETATKVTIDAVKGGFKGQELNRVYLLQVHSESAPSQVLLNRQKLKGYTNVEAFNAVKSGYYFDSREQQGILYVKTPYLTVKAVQKIIIKG